MPDVTYRESSTASVSEARAGNTHALTGAATRETGPASRRDTNARGEGGYFDGYMEGF